MEKYFKITKKHGEELYVDLAGMRKLFFNSPNLSNIIENLEFGEEIYYNDIMADVIRISESEYKQSGKKWKISVNDNSNILLEEVFNSIVLKTADGEKMAICMRDSGFEFKYQGKWYFAKEGYVEPFHTSDRGNLLVEQYHKEDKENKKPVN